MVNYDFKNLSSYDFELLTRDVLQKKLGVFIESFKTGKDDGIDLRFTKTKGSKTIIQCKHYANSGYSSLKRSLIEEVKKLSKIKCDEYIVVTSMGLTPNNKKELFEILYPYCKTEEYIIGREDLNNLLNLYPEVEKNNYKLWLTSTNLMENIIHSEIYNQSKVEIDFIMQKSKYYVQNKSFFVALNMLKTLNYCIITGIPGIGKTTLAEIIILHYIDKEYEVYKINSDIGEAYRVYNPNKKQLFYYDDFLGQTSLESKLNKNEDDKIIKFISIISKNKNVKFILTTREYILNSAKIYYEKFNNFNFDVNQCCIKLDDYTKFDKAKILFNHLYFSNIPQKAIDNLLIGKKYMNIINHINYNPRIIEWMTEQYINKEEEHFYTDFINMLNNPNKIWGHIFDNQLINPSKNLLVVLSTMPDLTAIDNLELSFNKYNSYICDKYGIDRNRDDFNKALKQLDGNFIKITQKGNGIVISFSNPSIKDFIELKVYQNKNEYLECIKSVVYFRQIRILLNRDINFINEKIKRNILESFKLVYKSDRTFCCDYKNIIGKEIDTLSNRLIYIIEKMNKFNIKDDKFILELLSQIIDNFDFYEMEDFLRLLNILSKNDIEISNFKEIVDLIINVIVDFLYEIEYIEEFNIIVKYLEKISNEGYYIEKNVLESIEQCYYDKKTSIIENEISNIDVADELSEYIELCNYINDYFGIIYDESQSEAYKLKLDELIEHEQEISGYEDYLYDEYRDSRIDEISNYDTEIENMFDSLNGS